RRPVLSGRHSLADADWPSPELLLGLLLPASSAQRRGGASGASSANSAGSSGSATASGWFGGRRRAVRCGTPTPARCVARASVAMSGAVPDSVFGRRSLCLDPFDRSHCLVFLRSDPTCVLFFSDLTPDSATPSGSNLHGPTSTSSTTGSGGISRSVSTYSERERSQAMRLLHMTAGLVSPGGGGQQQQQQGGHQAHPGKDAQSFEQQPCLQSRRNHVIAVYSREIVLIDLLINQPVASIALERSAAGFLRVHSCAHRDLLACLQETGAVSLRLRRPGLRRVTRHCGLADVCLDPLLETRLALATTDGRVAFWELTAQPAARRLQQQASRPRSRPASPESSALPVAPPRKPPPAVLAPTDATTGAPSGLPGA
uniref:WD_REPEATS_REGION domain-containing protein n=1 Tax=Macrostomum lignano TaxID=282301 RepID=A0A1I8FKX4_9PLAT